MEGEVDWNLEDWRLADFARQGVHTTTSRDSPTGDWRLDLVVNKDFSLCATYPQMLGVPARATPQQMTAVAAFRNRQRLPVLCYRSPVSGAALLRAAQPRPGLLQRRSVEDERWVDLIRTASGGRLSTAAFTLHFILGDICVSRKLCHMRNVIQRYSRNHSFDQAAHK